jgi:hypothetical protein
MNAVAKRFVAGALVLGGVLSVVTVHRAVAQPRAAAAAEAPYVVEWVYKAKWGYKEEYLRRFKQYQVPLLDRQKELGYILDYAIYTPLFHTGEDNRWDYRVIITYRDHDASTHEDEVARQLFPDQAAFKRDEQRRWELTMAHWDLPIRAIDPHAAD